VQGTRPNADSAFAEYILCAHTQLNRITFTYYATSIPRYNLRVVLRVTGEPTLISLHSNQKEIRKRVKESLRGYLNK
jgi:pyruvate/2-oxoglutarate/acetoin dehydrogenase E1 component